MPNIHEPMAYTIADTCRLSSLGRTRIYELINSGVLKATKVGKRTLVSAQSLRDLVNGGAT